ncbi:Protein furry [Blattella germanica]|nr:Protein furry [Blattella germanica]
MGEYPCDHYTAVINVTLMNTGCPRTLVHETALQLLQILDKRFFGAVGPLLAEGDIDLVQTKDCLFVGWLWLGKQQVHLVLIMETENLWSLDLFVKSGHIRDRAVHYTAYIVATSSFDMNFE